MNEDLELMMSEIPVNMTMDEADDFLCHYGKPGMKWHNRLYQNLDGTLTPLGRLHYGIGFKNIGQVEAARRAKEKADKEKEEARKAKEEEDRQKAVEKATKSGKVEEIYKLRESMTDEELTRAIRRMQATQQLESALRASGNQVFVSDTPPKKSIFGVFKEKKQAKKDAMAAEKAEKEAKEKAAAEAKKQQAMDALNKGMAILDTVTKTTNSITGAYQSYNKMASMINELGGNNRLPTWSQEPWKTPNNGKADKPIKEKDWKVTGKYTAKKETPEINIGTNSGWTTVPSDKPKQKLDIPTHTSNPFGSSGWTVKKDDAPAHTSNPYGSSGWPSSKSDAPAHTSSPFTGSKNSYWTTSTPSHTSSPFSGSTSKDWGSGSPSDSKKSSKSSDPLVSMLESYTSPSSYTTAAVADAIKSGASLSSIEKMTSGYSPSESIHYCDSLVSSYSVESGWESWKKQSSGLFHSEDEEEELYHYGTKHMRWGIRRYQNEDGSLTPEGRERYSKKRSEYGFDVDPHNLTKKQIAKQKEAGARYAIDREFIDDLDLFDDNDLRRMGYAEYKKMQTMERGQRAAVALIAGIGGTVMYGNPASGVASAAITATVNGAKAAAKSAIGGFGADYANDMVIGREALNNMMKNPDVYDTDVDKIVSNYKQRAQKGTAWSYKATRGK